MSPISSQPDLKQKAAGPAIVLIPWDPECPEHIERMYQQRIACTWNSDMIPTWREKQRAGVMALQWIMLAPSSIKDSLLAQHTAAYPLESSPLSDTALFLCGKPRAPSPATQFIPVGHIALDVWPGLAATYKISTFYVSRTLQGIGLGRAAMDAIEEMAISEPLNARVLRLDTIAKDYPGKAERRKALGLGDGDLKVVPVDWYLRRGYTIYSRNHDAYPTPDSTGKIYFATSVDMEKKIG